MMRTFPYQVLYKFCHDIFAAAGVEENCACAVTDSLMDAELTGVHTHGLIRLPIYIQRIQAGVVSPENHIRIVREGPSTLVVDAGNSFGAPSTAFAMNACIQKAEKTGACFATVRASNHFGTASFFARMAAKHDMIGFCCTNVTGKIVPYGGSKPYMGTNPFSVAIPTADESLPFVLDMTPTVVSLGKLILAQKQGKEIPLGWALDENGKPTTDPAAGRRGSLVPIAGPKGSGLAMAVELLCGVLSRAGCGPYLHDLYSFDEPQGIGHFVGAIAVAGFMDPSDFKAKASQMLQEIKRIKPAEGFREVMIPGERGAREAAARKKEGISLSEELCEELNELGRPYGIAL